MNLDDGYVRYEIGDIGKNETRHHHHHLICLTCGKVISFEDDLLEDLEKKIAITTGFSVQDHEVKLYGYCKECGGKLIE
jgi:Fur family ferric uptake transcriptional regulator